MKNKIAIFHKGPVRPNWQICKNNIDKVNQSFSSYQIENFIFAWDNDRSRELVKNIERANIFLLKEPTNEYIDSIFYFQTPQGSNKYNAFKHFWTMKYATEAINNFCDNFSHIVYVRMDTDYQFIDIPNLLTDKYTLLQGYEFFIDMVGIAPPEIMKQAWDYKDMKTLNDIYKNSLYPEHCWNKIMEMNQVPYNAYVGFDASCDPISKKYDIKYEYHPLRHR